MGDEEREVFLKMKKLEKKNYSRLNWFQNNIAHGQPNHWRCRAGARYVYICEDGLVHYCSQQRGYPGTPLEQYTVERHPAGVSDGKKLRAALHGFVRAPSFLFRFLARSADKANAAIARRCKANWFKLSRRFRRQ